MPTWEATVPQVDKALAGDGIHPNTEGAEAYARIVRESLGALQKPNELPLEPEKFNIYSLIYR